MLKVNHVDHLNLQVKNLKETVRFYQRHFGFNIYEEGIGSSNQRPYNIIGISNKIMLCFIETGSNITIKGLNHFGLHLDDFEEALKYLKGQGIELLYGGINQYPGSRSAYIADPNGYEIELSENFGGAL